MKAGQVFSGLRWMTAATAVNAVAQLLVLSVLARMLDPAAFGMVAMTGIALRFASYFSQLGVLQTLIQKPSLHPEDVTAALILTAGVSLVLFGVVYVAAPLFAVYFVAEELTELLRVAAFALVISALSGVSMALLRREGRFRVVALTEVTGYILGYAVVGVMCAYAGMGPWSLVFAGIAQASVVCILTMAVARPTLVWPVHRASFGHTLNNGSRYSLIGFLEFLGVNIETLFMGRFLGAHDLGVFNRSQTLTNLPVEQAVNAVGKVLFPALSAIQQDVTRRADVFLALLLCIGAFSTGIAMTVAAAAPEIVAVMLGSNWADAIPVMRVIAFAVPALFLYFVCGIAMDSVAALNTKLRLQTVAVLAKLALILALSGHGLMGVVVAVVVGEYVRLFLGLHACMRVLGVSLKQVAGVVVSALAHGWIVFLLVQVARQTSQSLDLPLAGVIASEAIGWGISAIAAGLLFTRQLGSLPATQRVDSLRRIHLRLGRLYRLRPVGA